MEEILKDDEEQWGWLTEIESRIEELQILRDSPEKPPALNDGFICPKPEPRFGRHSYDDFLRIQTQANRDTERKLREQEARSKKLEERLAALNIDDKPAPQPHKTDSKSALKLPTCPPVTFTGEIGLSLSLSFYFISIELLF